MPISPFSKASNRERSFDKRLKFNVSSVAASGLCCSCGACQFVCAPGAISYSETTGGYVLPTVDNLKCTECGVCMSICPGVGIAPCVADNVVYDPFVGVSLQTYVGKATSERVCVNSQSGGIVSALLIGALERKEIAGAVTVVMPAGNPPRAQVTLATSAQDIQDAQKSKYCPVPLLSILSEIEKLDGHVAFVGLGCHVLGLQNVCERFPNLKERIAFCIGLICDRTMTYGAVDFLLKKGRVPMDESKVLHFRDKTCGGYPGNVNIICSNGLSKVLPSSMRVGIKDFFTPTRCRLCFDKMNVFSDITVGDPWGVMGVDSFRGESVAVTRTEIGAEVFDRALNAGDIVVRHIAYEEVLAGQGIERRRVDWHGYIEAWRELGRPLPSFCPLIESLSSSQQANGPYHNRLQESIALDAYPSRAALLAAAGKQLFFNEIRRRAALPIRFVRRVLNRILKVIIQRHSGC